ncbi:Ig-like domain-containing protein, partial [Streptococcus cuniculipharyngis]
MFRPNKHRDTAQRFTIKKFKFGAASVLIGTVFAVFAGGVQAEEQASSAEPASSSPSTTLVTPESAAPASSTEVSPVSESAPAVSSEVAEVPAASSTAVVETSTAAPVSEVSESSEAASSTASSESAKSEESSRTSSQAAKAPTSQAPAKQEVVAESAPLSASEAATATRVAATTYKVTYTDLATGEVVYTTPTKTVSEETTLPKSEAVSFNLSVKNELATTPDLKGYKLAEGQAAVQAAVVVERGGKKNLVNFNVVRDDVAAAAGPDETEGYAGFRAISTEKTTADQVTDLIGPNGGDRSTQFRETANKDQTNAVRQITWVDFADTSSFFNLKTVDRDKALQVGSYFEKEIYPGYVVRLEVVALRPFDATETFRDRVAGTADEALYRPDKINADRDTGTIPVDIIVASQDGWSVAKARYGINGGTQPTFRSRVNGGNVGVEFSVSATYLGQAVPSAVVMTTGEEASYGELEIYTTDGKPFELFAEMSNDTTTMSAMPITYDVDWKPTTYPIKYWGNANPTTSRIAKEGRLDGTTNDRTSAVFGDGIGTQVFGPVVTRRDSPTVALPIVMTREASRVGVYINTAGRQSTMIGVVVYDQGDAPESYGSAQHLVSNRVNSPYLGSAAPDVDIKGVGTEIDWETDDTAAANDEGVRQLVPEDEIFTTASGQETYKLKRAGENDYSLTFKANPNGNPEAFVRAWADFNNNGVFDENEVSDLVTVTAEGNYTVNWTTTQIVDTSVTKLGVRMRTALNQYDIATPTGMAYSGEVEDFTVQVTHPPRGDKETTTGYVNEVQRINIAFNTAGAGVAATDTSGNGTTEFTSYGRRDYNFEVDNTMNENIAVKIVDPSGNLVGTYTEAGVGTYIVENKTVTFIPVDGWTGTAKGVVLRAVDSNGVSTGWTARTADNGLENVNDGSHSYPTATMDAVYIPTVLNLEPTGTNKETRDYINTPQSQDTTSMFAPGTDGTGTEALQPSSLTLLDANGAPATTVTVAEGTYTLAGKVITFTPNTNYVGTATPVTVRMADLSGDTATATYTPTVINLTPTGTNKETSDYINRPQSQDTSSMFTPGTDGTGTEALNPDSLTILDANNSPATTVTVAEGTYTLSGKTITFTPNTNYVGTATPVTVRMADLSGDTATATYTPTVINLTPTASPAETTDKQGQKQSTNAKSMFAPGTDGTGTEALDPASLTLLDADGNPTDTVTVDGQGTYVLDSEGKITFTPEPGFTGPTSGVSVRISDLSGDTATDKYTPTVTPITPTAEPRETSGPQGKAQKTDAKTMFTEGDEVAPIDNSTITLLDAEGNPTKTVTVENEGTYTLNDDGTITFQPEPSFVGKGQGVRVQAADKNGTKVSDTYTPTVTD